MRFSLAVVLAFAAVASAGALRVRQDDLPECAKKCRAETNTFNCKPDDTVCLCKSHMYVKAIHDCVEEKCDKKDHEAAFDSLTKLCLRSGVTLTPPTATRI